jgi:hypothetical protein
MGGNVAWTEESCWICWPSSFYPWLRHVALNGARTVQTVIAVRDAAGRAVTLQRSIAGATVERERRTSVGLDTIFASRLVSLHIHCNDKIRHNISHAPT